MSDLECYTLARFVKLTKQVEELSPVFNQESQEVNQRTEFKAKIDIEKVVADNMVFGAYGEQLDKVKLLESLHLVIDVRNQGFVDQIKHHTSVVLSVE